MKCVLILVALAAFLSLSEATSCYTCRSSGNAGYCWTKQENDERTPKTNCPTGWCLIKTDVPLKGEVGDKKPVSTSRACMRKVPEKIASECVSKTVGVLNSTTCFCQGDLCNNQATVAEKTY